MPSFPKHPELYHKGAVAFFLDCPEPLTDRQISALKAIVAKSQREMNEAEQKVARAERMLWKLTGAASPDAAAISTAISEIERTRAQQRMTFIRRVGEAASVLDDRQRTAMIRGAPSAEARQADAPFSGADATPPEPTRKPKKRAPARSKEPAPEPEPPAEADGADDG